MQDNSSARALDAAQRHEPVLVINGGSSSIRFALYEPGNKDTPPRQIFDGEVSRPIHGQLSLTIKDSAGKPKSVSESDRSDSGAEVALLMGWLEQNQILVSLQAVGHRIVHGMAHFQPERVTSELLEELVRITPYDPDHLPLEIELIKAIEKRRPNLPQVVCFDTAFHRNMPRVATLLPLPRRYDTAGVRRYGFHGLSYEFLLEELTRLGDSTATQGRVILAHLGSGASLAAVRDGKSVDTSMGFTPTAGVVMSTRSGDLDPGLVSYLSRTEQMNAAKFQNMVNHASGLLGVSETSSDMRELLTIENKDYRAAEAIALFCYQIKKWIGAFAAVLGGIDTLVFAGGIGENSPTVRARVCDGMSFLGVEIDESRNLESKGVISSSQSRTTVRVIHTDEQLMIARSVFLVLGLNTRRGIKP